MRLSISGLALSTLPSRGMRIAIALPGTRLMKNSQRQLKLSVIQPPTVGPSVGASVAVTPSTAGTMARRLPVNSANPVAKTVGTIAPPTNPCTARNTVIDWMSQAIPQKRLDVVNRTAESVNSQRVEIASERKAESGIIT